MSVVKKIIDDFNGTSKNIIVPYSKKLTGGYEVNIAKFSGLVSVHNRRSSKEIADEWSNKIFGKSFQIINIHQEYRPSSQDMYMYLKLLLKTCN